MLHSLEGVSQLSDGNMVEFSQAPRQPPVVTQWNSFQFPSSIFQISQGFSAAAFPLALIAKMVHNLPYLFPQDPEPPPNRKCLIWNDFSPEKIKKCRWLNYTATNFLLWEQKTGVFVKTTFLSMIKLLLGGDDPLSIIPDICHFFSTYPIFY